MHTDGARHERGAAMITVLVALGALLAAGALAIEGGLMWTARTQMQNVADAAALAAAEHMKDTSCVVDLGRGIAEGKAMGQGNVSVANPGIALADEDFVFGKWNLACSGIDADCLDENVDTNDGSQVTAVQVTARTAHEDNNPVPAILARLLGKEGFEVKAEATALRGAPGEGVVDLPLAIDCCAITRPDGEPDWPGGPDLCGMENYCDTIARFPPRFGPDAPLSPENDGCFVEEDPTLSDDAVYPKTGAPNARFMSCLDLAPTGDQIGCWTAFDDESASVNTNELTSMVNSGDTWEISVGDQYYIDNGTKTPVIVDIADRFYGERAWRNRPQPEGVDTPQDLNNDGTIDSWVVRLPVIECQSGGDNCAKGTADRIRGFLCFHIREVIHQSVRRVKGEFMCSNHPEFHRCNLGDTTSGGDDFGVCARFPVLVR
jgi:hypothetical protein